MRLSSLFQPFIEIPGDFDVDIRRLILDSRKAEPLDLFFAIKGTASDGRKFIPEVIAKKVAAIVTVGDQASIEKKEGIPLITMPGLKEKMGDIAARFYDYPAKKLRMIGVTGTNGKTSCTHFMAQVLAKPTCVIGTLGSGMYGELSGTGLTTPDAITLQSLLHHACLEHAEMAAIEVSSHSIDQGRINGMQFEMGVFTNLTQDHLDYHVTMEAYAAIKKQFMVGASTTHAIINADDKYGLNWIKELAPHKPVYAYGCDLNQETLEHLKVPVVYATHTQLSLQGISTRVHSPWGEGELMIPLIGRFNLSNVLAVLTTMCFYGVPFKTVLERLTTVMPVPGRMQTISREGKPLVVVDYSHTPDALLKALQALRLHTLGKLICVFGCGGDRDPGKRPMMAKIAEKLADRVIVTNDNPRHEDPEDIARQILAGFLEPNRVSVLLDRSKAIENSIQYAVASDCILVAGKGAETYQQFGDERIHFDDVEEVRKYLSLKF